MGYLPLANILHHKLRSVLCAVGIGIGICMLVTLSGLARGSLAEVADRWESIDADLIAYPDIWGQNITTLAGVALSDRYAAKISEAGGDAVQNVVPVFLWQMKLAGQDHMVAGVDPQDWEVLTGGRGIEKGRLFDPQDRFSAWIQQRLGGDVDHSDEVIDITPAELADPDHCGLELVIDSRLAAAGSYAVGDTVTTANHEWKIVGVTPVGGMARAYIPRRCAQFLFGGADITKSTLMFIKLTPPADPAGAIPKLRTAGLQMAPLSQYRRMLEQKFAIMFRYVDAVNAITLIVVFLFIMITLYTMVLQRQRDIAILKSCGASNGFILRQVLTESALLTAGGAFIGVAGSFAAAWAIETARPLLTVSITFEWIVIAVAAGAVGALISGLYPAWQATRVDMVEALAWE